MMNLSQADHCENKPQYKEEGILKHKDDRTELSIVKVIFFWGLLFSTTTSGSQMKHLITD